MSTNRKWTEKEIKYVIEQTRKKSDEEIAARLGRSKASISRCRHRWNQKHPEQAVNQPYVPIEKAWTQEELDYLLSKSGQISDLKIAQQLGKSVYAVKQKRHRWNQAQQEKDKKGGFRKYKEWTQKEIDFLVNNNGKYSEVEMAAKLNRTVSAVATFRYKWNLKNPDQAIHQKKVWNTYPPGLKDKVLDLLGVKPLHLIAEELGETEKRLEFAIRNWSYTESDLSVKTEIDYFRVSTIAESIGVHSQTVRKWICKGYLKACRKQAEHRTMWTVSAANWREFCKNHPKKVVHLNQEGVEWLKGIDSELEKVAIYSQSQLAKHLEIPVERVKKWTSKGWLRSDRIPDKRYPHGVCIIDRLAFNDFCENFPNLIANIDSNNIAIVQEGLLSGT